MEGSSSSYKSVILESYLAANQDPNAIVEAVYDDNESVLEDEELHMPFNFDTNSPSKTPEANIIYTHTCPVCDRGFKNVGHLKCHYRSSHRDSMPFQLLMDSSIKCEICNKYFSFQSSLDAHVKTHIKKKKAKRVQPYQCDICFKKFSLKFSLESHYYSHNNFLNVKKPSSPNLTHSEEPNNCKKGPNQEHCDRSHTE